MRVLLLSFYFPPDLSAGSFRARPLVDALLEAGAGALHVDVLTALPNRYHSHARDAMEREEHEGCTICRFRLPTHRSGMMDQARAFATYAWAVSTAVRGRKWDIVVATSSRLMTAALGARIAGKCGAKLYLDIRDLFTDTMGDLLRGSPLRLLLPAFRLVERRAFRSAARINLVSPGFLKHLQEVAPGKECRVFTNGVDDEFLSLDFRNPNRALRAPILIVYAGNMGEGQGLHNVVPGAAKLLEGSARFRLIGDGGRRRQLEDALIREGIANVELLDPMPRDALYAHYREADVLFTHLNDVPAFERVLPSKLFEYAATGKPILAGVGGFAAQFLREEVSGAEVFRPCNIAEMVQSARRLELGEGTIDRQSFRQRFARRDIMLAMARDILALGRSQ